MNRQRILVLGGGYAGMLAASRASRAGSRVQVTLVDARPAFVQRIRHHEALAGGSPRALEYAPLLSRRGIGFERGWAEGVDLDRREAAVRAPDGTLRRLGFDRLVLALGSRTAPGAPGVAEHAVRLDDPEAVREAGRRIAALAGSRGRVVVVGGGLTGIETAAELAERHPGLRVTLLSADPVAADYAPRAEAHVRGRLRDLSVRVREGERVAAVEPGRVRLEGGGEVPFELCVWCGGFEASPLPAAWGLEVDPAGRVRVDGSLRARGREDVFVAGDLASVPRAGEALRMSCQAAMPMGAHVGDALAGLARGREPEPFSFAFSLRCVSLGRRDGLMQFTDFADRPTSRVITGRLAALGKEAICRATYEFVRNELRTGMRLYRWPGRVFGDEPGSGEPALAAA